MATKRKKHGGSAVEFTNSRGNTLGSSADFAKPIYLVAEQENEQSPYSVIKVDAAAVAGGNEPLRARTVAGLRGAWHGMSFVAAHSEHGSWIVGMGGHQHHTGGTIIFDPSTLKTFQGPCTVWPMREPVLISHGGEVYVISRIPKVERYLDFEPWFQSLSFKDGVPSIDCGNFGSWSFLPAPPFFPCVLDPYEFADPPEVIVTSYAVVGSHILLSPQPELKLGTYGFHVVEKTWEKVCDENLPFAGQAVPLGGSLFAACPISNDGNPLTAASSVFRMSLRATHTQEAGTLRLCIQEFRAVASEEKIHRPLFCPLGKGRFCSIRLGSRKANCRKRAQIILTTVQTEGTEAEVAIQVKEHIHTYKCNSRFGVIDSTMPVVAALSTEREDIELFEGHYLRPLVPEDKQTSGKTTNNTIFDAPVIPMS